MMAANTATMAVRMIVRVMSEAFRRSVSKATRAGDLIYFFMGVVGNA